MKAACKNLQWAAFAAALASACLWTSRDADAVIIVASADTYVQDGGVTPLGASTDVSVRYNTGATERNEIMMFRFDISSLPTTILSASLNLTSTRNHSPNYAMNLFGSSDPTLNGWDEANTTWDGVGVNAAPAFMFPDGPDHSLNDEVGDGSSLYDQWDLIPNGNTGTDGMLLQELMGTDAAAGLSSSADLDVTFSFNDASVAAFLQQARMNGHDTATFVVATRTAASGQFKLYSRESGAAEAFLPHLDVTGVPEPTSVVTAFAAIACLAFVRFARRR